jgi:hypothetical protein
MPVKNKTWQEPLTCQVFFGNENHFVKTTTINKPPARITWSDQFNNNSKLPDFYLGLKDLTVI